MSLLRDLKMYGRFAWGLRSFLRHTKSLEDARAIVQRRLAEREANFVRLVERGIFGHPRSPYLSLLRLARCEMGDIQSMVRVKGLEATLRELREAGVYFTFEEFKGLEPVVRHGQVIHVEPHDFDNPYLSSYYQHETGGTSGAGTRVDTDLDFLAAQVPHHILTQDMHGVLDGPQVVWRPVLPSGSGINNVLRSCHQGRPPEKWYTPVVTRDIRPPLKYHLAKQGTVAIGRLFGVPIPWPEPVRLADAIIVARWVVETLRVHGKCLILTPVSCALRVCVAAHEEGLNLSGATFMIAGEPATPAKVRGILRTGARYFTTYGMAESGRVGMGCGQPVVCSDVHFLRDAFGLVQFPRRVPGSELNVNAFSLTSLLPSAPKLMLNIETDDYGVFEQRSCGCQLEAYGFTEHLREIRSFNKLSGEGVTLVGSEMITILEEVLPARFGGSPLDYQLLEEEDEEGFTRLSLVVSPKIRITDETKVIETVMDSLARGSVGASLSVAIWDQAGSFRVKRREPVWTSRGKLMSLHVARDTDPSTSKSAR